MRKIHGKLVCESVEEVLNPEWTAVLAIDLQKGFMLPGGSVDKAGGDISAMVELIPKCVEFLAAARGRGIRIVHVRWVDLPDGASDSPAWLRSKGLMTGTTEFALEGSWDAEFVAGCEPLPGEPVVTKHRSSAFTGTNLEQLLRATGVQAVALIGEQTPGCIEATFRDAAYRDFYNVLIEDRIAARDPELHEASLKVQRARHDVITAEKALSIWDGYRAGRLLPPNP